MLWGLILHSLTLYAFIYCPAMQDILLIFYI